MKSLIPAWTLGLALVTACGGGGGGGDEQKYPDPTAASFDYKTGLAVDLGGADSAMVFVVGDATSIVDFDGNASPPVDAALNVIRSSSGLASYFPDASDPVSVPDSAPASLRAAVETTGTNPFDVGDCVTATEDSLTFKGCVVTRQGNTYKLDGHLQRFDNPRSPPTIDWDVRVRTADRLGETAAARSTQHVTGHLQVYPGGVSGWAKADVAHTVTYGTTTRESAFTNYTDMSLDRTDDCISGGDVEVRHLWAKQPSDLRATTLPDVGVEVSWSACELASAIEVKK